MIISSDTSWRSDNLPSTISSYHHTSHSSSLLVWWDLRPIGEMGWSPPTTLKIRWDGRLWDKIWWDYEMVSCETDIEMSDDGKLWDKIWWDDMVVRQIFKKNLLFLSLSISQPSHSPNHHLMVKMEMRKELWLWRKISTIGHQTNNQKYFHLIYHLLVVAISYHLDFSVCNPQRCG